MKKRKNYFRLAIDNKKKACTFVSQFAAKAVELKRESSSVGRARPCQGRGRGFEPRFSLKFYIMLEWFVFN